MICGLEAEKMVRAVVRRMAPDIYKETLQVEFLPKSLLTSTIGEVIGGPWYNCIALVQEKGTITIRASNGYK